MYTIRYSTEDYRGRVDFSCYTEDTYEEAWKTFNNVCSSLRSDFYAYCYCKIWVSLMAEDIMLEEYSLSDTGE